VLDEDIRHTAGENAHPQIRVLVEALLELLPLGTNLGHPQVLRWVVESPDDNWAFFLNLEEFGFVRHGDSFPVTIF